METSVAPSLRQIEDQVLTDLRFIRRHYHQVTTKIGGAKIGRGSRSSSDLDPMTKAASDAGEVQATLVFWCRVVLEDFNVTTVHLDGHDVRQLCDFLMTWTRHMTGAEDAARFAAEISDAEQTVHRYAYPSKKDSVRLGTCPVTLAQDGEQVVCGTEIRARSGEPITCPRCGTDDTLHGWEQRILGPSQLVTADQLVMHLRRTVSGSITTDLIRKWCQRKLIEAAGKDEQGRNLFDRTEVVRRLQLKRGA